MDPLTISALQGTGLAVYIWYLFRALKQQVSGLKDVVSAQKQTMEVMERRISETEKIGGIYKNLLADLPADLEKYKSIVARMKDGQILELQDQFDGTQRKLLAAQAELQKTGATEEVLASQLRILKKLMSHRPGKGSAKEELDLRKLIEFRYSEIEAAIPVIQQCQTDDEFLIKSGYIINAAADYEAIHTIFKNGRMPDGRKIGSGFANSYTGVYGEGWLAVADNQIWLTESRYESLGDEFSFVKHVV